MASLSGSHSIQSSIASQFVALLLLIATTELASVNGFLPQQDVLSADELVFSNSRVPGNGENSGFDWNQPYRTAFHFQPRKNWMNDPNGPMLYRGVYHLFYQYNPKDTKWDKTIVWGHSTSTDLINWTQQKTALTRSIKSDINGCWSGSATLIPATIAAAAYNYYNKSHHNSDPVPAILYTGMSSQDHQLQNLALPKDPTDPYLRDWIKHPHNPVMVPAPGSRINKTEFRDPSTAWQLPDGTWRVTMGTIDESRNKLMAVMFKSSDFVNWVETDRVLHSTNGTNMWECPDFFPVYKGRQLGAETSTIGSNLKHVLKISLFGVSYEYYTVGRYNVRKDVYVPEVGSVETNVGGLRFDYGKFYASKSFYDGVNRRRVLWGWVNESCSEVDDRKKGWSGVQSIPRTILLDESEKELVFWPVKEVEKLRTNRVGFSNYKRLVGRSMVEVYGITAAQADVEVTFRVRDIKKLWEKAEKLDPSWTDPQWLCNQKMMGGSVKGGVGPFGLLVLASESLEEYTAVFFRIFKSNSGSMVVLMCSDQSKASLNPTNDKLSFGTFVNVDPTREDLSLRTLIDHSIIESFGAKGKNPITARVYPTLAIHEKARLYAFNNGVEDVVITNLNAWSMKKAHVNENRVATR